MKAVYPVIFTFDKEEKVYYIDAFDFNKLPNVGAYSQGFSLGEAIDMARDLISLTALAIIDTDGELPQSSSINDVDVTKGEFAGQGQSFVTLIDVDLDEYRRKVDTKMVRRNVTLPNWLDRQAKAERVNVSRVLQEALLEKLHI